MAIGTSSKGTPDGLGSGGEEIPLTTRSIRSIEVIRAAAGEGYGPGPPPDAPEREGGLQTQIRKKTTRPDKYKVLLYNDDYTPMEFVVALLQKLFGKGPAAATQIMLSIHRSGLGVAGVYVLEVAETKVAAVHRMAEQRGYPLRAGVEKE
jgi:ATP-dependent Clp protease adaptor protein ClpS